MQAGVILTSQLRRWWIAVLWIFSVLLWPGLGQAATNTYLFTYTSREALLSAGWSFVATAADGSERNTEVTNFTAGALASYDQIAHPGTLRIPVDVGNLWGGLNDSRNSLFHSLASNWVSVRLQMTFSPAWDYQQADLLLYQDDDNYVSIGHAHSGEEKVAFWREFSGFPLDLSGNVVNASDIFLRLDRDLGTEGISAFYSLNGTNWTAMGQVSQALVNPRVCLWSGASVIDWTNGAVSTDFRGLDVITSDSYVPQVPGLKVSPAHLVFNCVADQPCTNWQQLSVVLGRDQDPSAHWILTNGAPWLLAEASQGDTPSACDVGVDMSNMEAGVYQGYLAFGAPGATSAVAQVTLVVNPSSRARVASWHGARSGAMSVSVDDSNGTAFDDLSTNGFGGTYFGTGLAAPSFYPTYYQAGMELGSHTVDHPCINEISEPLLRYEIEANVNGLCGTTPQPCANFISFAWPCGTTSFKMESIAADYFLSARGYNVNELEDATPRDFMNLRSFNSHEHDPYPPSDLKTVVDAAINQGKWFNLVLHTTNDDDGAIAYALNKDIWVAPIGSVVKYILQRDRTVITNYIESPGEVRFDFYRLPLDTTAKRDFENALGPQDDITLQIEVTAVESVGGLTINGTSAPYRIEPRNGQKVLLANCLVTVDPQTLVLQVTGSNSPPVLGTTPADQVVEELSTLIVTNAANDSDLPTQTLSYRLVNAPAGAQVASNGVIQWTPSEAQGPGVYKLTTIVTDDGVPALSATNSFTVTVQEVNRNPVLPPQNDRTVNGPLPVVITNTASDSDLPPNPLLYQLLSAPPGATIDANGVIFWSPTASQIPSTNVFTTLATDSNPLAINDQELSVSNTFVIILQPPLAPVLPPREDVVINEGRLLVVTNLAYDSPVVDRRVTNSIVFSYPNRTALVADGWSFIATDAAGEPRNTEITNSADPAILSYDQSTHPGVLRIPCTVGDLWAEINTSTNSLFRSLPTNWVTMQLYLSFYPVENYQQVHLALSQNDDNYVQVGLAYNEGLGGEVTTIIQELDGVPQHSGIILNSVTNIYLRMERSGTDGAITGLYSTNGTTWVLIASYDHAFRSPRLNIWCGGSPVPYTTGAPYVDLRRLDLVFSNAVPTSLTYSLLNPPAGASIDSQGVIRWAPSDAQGPSTNLITTVVTDNAAPPRSATNSFLVVVQEINNPPVLVAQTNWIIDELTTLVVNNSVKSPITKNVISFNYTNRDALFADGWSFLATTGSGTLRNTEITNPAAGAVISYDQASHPGILRIPCDSGDLWGSANNTRNSLFRNLSPNWLSMQLALTFAPSQNYQQSHLGLYQDDDNYINMTFGYNGSRGFSFTEEIAGSPHTVNRITTTVTNVWIRLDRDLITGIISGLYSIDGTNWVAVGTVHNDLINPRLFIWCGASPEGFPNCDLKSLVVVEAADDGDLPANSVTYTLVDPPPGAAIDGNGVITWTPTEAQGPGTNVITTIATDYNPWAINEQHLSATNSFTVVVNEVNTAPVLPSEPDLVVLEKTFVVVTNTAFDPDAPANALTYILIDAPAGATVDTNGVISWTPTEGQGPSTNVITTVVTDLNPWAINAHQLSATNSFMIVVNEMNSAPTLPAQPDVILAGRQLLTVTNAAFDEDIPGNALTYSLLTSPPGATISTNGVITWLPTTAPVPNTNVFRTVVTDYNPLAANEQHLSATNAFVVIVEGVHNGPSLPIQTNRSIMEFAGLLITNSAIDSDLPPLPLHYGFVEAPEGAVIDTNGVISWMPTEAQGPSTNEFVVMVTDEGEPPLSATNSFVVVVDESNQAPILPIQSNLVVSELTAVLVTNTASDLDIPTNTLSYQLLDAPAGASIDTNGVISWTPAEAQGPSTNVITTVVTDLNPWAVDSQKLSATNSFVIVVNEMNSAPILAAQPDVVLAGRRLLVVTNSAFDPDLPANVLSYGLLNAPQGAMIDTNGVITWLPTTAPVPNTNVFTTIVTDYSPEAVNERHLSATNSFVVIVEGLRDGPTMPSQTNWIGMELTTLLITNSAIDYDLPVLGLHYAFLSAPEGAVIDTNGVISWMPTEAQAPSTNDFVVTVTDDGEPPLSATNAFTVFVTESNQPPVLAALSDVVVWGPTPIVVTNRATDPDIPVNSLSYALTTGPAGAVIDTNGVIYWTPALAEVPSSNLFTTVATDYNPWAVNEQHLSVTNTFNVIVRAIHNGPILPEQTSRAVVELTTLIITNTAADSDIPLPGLTYQLVGAPEGMTIDTNGIITWTPSEAQGPSTNLVETIVVDSSPEALESRNAFTITVEEVNAPPVLPSQPDVVSTETAAIIVTNTAVDPDLPVNDLSYTLERAPEGASIDTNGVIVWAPSLAQVPSTNVFTTVVADLNPWAINDHTLRATNSFSVLVNAVHGPSLPDQTNRTVLEMSSLVVTNSATDSDIPAPVLSYVLVDPPAGAMIDTNGVIAWTPSEAQGPSTNEIRTVVTDDRQPPVSFTNSFIVVVEEINTAPVLSSQEDRAVDGVSSLIVTNRAVDGDLPENTLQYELLEAPLGASVDTNGVISWTPAVAQVPSTNSFVMAVTDFNPWAVNEQHLSATNALTVIVSAVPNQVNQPPVLPVIGNRILIGDEPLTVYNTASDPDLPPNPLYYELLTAPAGASIDDHGVIRWVPSELQVPSTNVFETRVTDYNPWAMNSQHLTAENSFRVIVAIPGSILIQFISVSNGVATVTWSAIDGQSYRLQYKNHLTDEAWQDLIPDVTATGSTASATDAPGIVEERYYRVVRVQ